MTALNFPSSPAYNDVYGKYRWDNEKWVPGHTVLPSLAWTPANLTGLKGWWDASVYASLTLSGSNITDVADQSGAGNHLTQGVAPPVYNATGFNSLPTMTFTNDKLAKASFPMGTGNELTIFFVGILDASTGSFGRAVSYHGGGSDDTSTTSFLLARNAGNDQMALYRNGTTAVGAVTTGVPVRVIATISSSGVQTIYVGGVSTTGGTLSTAFGATGTLAVGMAAHNNTSGWSSVISEVGVATGYHDATTVGLLDTYLKTKWGLS